MQVVFACWCTLKHSCKCWPFAYLVFNIWRFENNFIPVCFGECCICALKRQIDKYKLFFICWSQHQLETQSDHGMGTSLHHTVLSLQTGELAHHHKTNCFYLLTLVTTGNAQQPQHGDAMTCALTSSNSMRMLWGFCISTPLLLWATYCHRFEEIKQDCFCKCFKVC